MPLLEKVLSDVCQAIEEKGVPFFFLLTGQRGSGKSFFLRSFLTKLVEGFGATEVTSLTTLLASQGRDMEASNSLFTYRLTYDTILTCSRAIKTSENNDFIFLPPRTIVTADDLPSLWALCILNDLSNLMKRFLLCALRSPSCVLVCSALSVSSLPSFLLQSCRPLLYEISSAACVDVGVSVLDADAELSQLNSLATQVAPHPMAFRDTLMAICMTKLISRGDKEDNFTSSDSLSVVMREYLNYVNGSLRQQQIFQPENLYGLDTIRLRLSVLISTFAIAQKPEGCGKLLMALPSTTGILLHGPSGCGKSALIRELATDFSSVAFDFVDCTRLFSKYLGASEEKLREIYRKARLETPSVVVLENIDVIAQSRGGMQRSESSGPQSGVNVNRRMLACLLCELDGVTDNSGVLTIGTTNAPHVIDKALLRRGRLESILLVSSLTFQAAKELCCYFFNHFKAGSAERESCIDRVAREAEGCSPVGLKFVLRKLLERSLAEASASRGDLVLPTQSTIEATLLESAPLMFRIHYPFSEL